MVNLFCSRHGFVAFFAVAVVLLSTAATGATATASAKNWALGQATLAKSEAYRTTSTGGVDGVLGDDGGVAGLMRPGGACFHSGNAAGQWWRVQLQTEIFVSEVLVQGRTKCCEAQGTGIAVHVGNSIADKSGLGNPTCGGFGREHDVAGRLAPISCGLVGRYVTLNKASSGAMVFCEVAVHGSALEVGGDETPSPRVSGCTTARYTADRPDPVWLSEDFSERTSMVFFAKGRNDAHVLLRRASSQLPAVQIVIGGWSNTKSVVRVYSTTDMARTTVATVQHSVLDPDSWTAFWVAWGSDRGIRVGTGTQVDESRFLQVADLVAGVTAEDPIVHPGFASYNRLMTFDLLLCPQGSCFVQPLRTQDQRVALGHRVDPYGELVVSVTGSKVELMVWSQGGASRGLVQVWLEGAQVQLRRNAAAGGWTAWLDGEASEETRLHSDTWRTFWLRWHDDGRVAVGAGTRVGHGTLVAATEAAAWVDGLRPALGKVRSWGVAHWRHSTCPRACERVEITALSAVPIPLHEVVVRGFVVFDALAAHDANLLLYGGSGDVGWAYQVIVAGWSGTATVIRRAVQLSGTGESYQEVARAAHGATHVLQDSRWRAVWVSFGGPGGGATVAVGRGLRVGEEVLTHFHDPDYLEVEGVAAISYGQSARFRVRSCPASCFVESYRTTGSSAQLVRVHSAHHRAQEHLVFEATGQQDAKVRLTATDGSVILFTFGGWNNQKSQIRKGGQSKVMVDSALGRNLLSTSSFRSFWISWGAGRFAMGKGARPGTDELGAWQNDANAGAGAIVVDKIELTGWGNFAVDWRLHACDERQTCGSPPGLPAGALSTCSSEMGSVPAGSSCRVGCSVFAGEQTAVCLAGARPHWSPVGLTCSAPALHCLSGDEVTFPAGSYVARATCPGGYEPVGWQSLALVAPIDAATSITHQECTEQGCRAYCVGSACTGRAKCCRLREGNGHSQEAACFNTLGKQQGSNYQWTARDGCPAYAAVVGPGKVQAKKEGAWHSYHVLAKLGDGRWCSLRNDRVAVGRRRRRPRGEEEEELQVQPQPRPQPQPQPQPQPRRRARRGLLERQRREKYHLGFRCEGSSHQAIRLSKSMDAHATSGDPPASAITDVRVRHGDDCILAMTDAPLIHWMCKTEGVADSEGGLFTLHPRTDGTYGLTHTDPATGITYGLAAPLATVSSMEWIKEYPGDPLHLKPTGKVGNNVRGVDCADGGCRALGRFHGAVETRCCAQMHCATAAAGQTRSAAGPGVWTGWSRCPAGTVATGIALAASSGTGNFRTLSGWQCSDTACRARFSDGGGDVRARCCKSSVSAGDGGSGAVQYSVSATVDTAESYEDSDAGDGETLVLTNHYVVYLTVHDAAGSPAADAALKLALLFVADDVRSSVRVQFNTEEGLGYRLFTKTGYQVLSRAADGLGKLELRIPVGESGILCPALLVETPDGTQHVIYPDMEAHRRLAESSCEEMREGRSGGGAGMLSGLTPAAASGACEATRMLASGLNGASSSSVGRRRTRRAAAGGAAGAGEVEAGSDAAAGTAAGLGQRPLDLRNMSPHVRITLPSREARDRVRAAGGAVGAESGYERRRRADVREDTELPQHGGKVRPDAAAGRQRRAALGGLRFERLPGLKIQAGDALNANDAAGQRLFRQVGDLARRGLVRMERGAVVESPALRRQHRHRSAAPIGRSHVRRLQRRRLDEPTRRVAAAGVGAGGELELSDAWLRHPLLPEYLRRRSRAGDAAAAAAAAAAGADVEAGGRERRFLKKAGKWVDKNVVKPVDEAIVKPVDKAVVKPAVQFVDKATGAIVEFGEGVAQAFESVVGDIGDAYNAVKDGIGELGLDDLGKAIMLATTGSGLTYLFEAGASLLNSAVVGWAVEMVRNAGQVIATSVVSLGKRMYAGAAMALRVVGNAFASALEFVVDGIVHVCVAFVDSMVALGELLLDVLETIGAAILEVIEFLLSLLEWADIVNTAKVVNKHLENCLDYAVNLVSGWDFKAFFSGIGDTIEEAFQSIELPSLPEPGSSDASDAAMYIPNLIMSAVSKFVKLMVSGFLEVLEAFGVPTGMFEQLAEFASAFAGLLSFDGEKILAAIGKVIGLVFDVVGYIVDGLRELLEIVLRGVRALFTTRINLPVVTKLYETVVVPGGKFTLLSVVSLFIGAPFTIIWKLLSGGSAPFSDSDTSTLTSLNSDQYADEVMGGDMRDDAARRQRRLLREESGGAEDYNVARRQRRGTVLSAKVIIYACLSTTGVLLYALAALAEAKKGKVMEAGADLVYFYANTLFVPLMEPAGGLRWIWWLFQFYPLATDCAVGRELAWRTSVASAIVGLLLHTGTYIVSVLAAESTGNSNVLVYTHLYGWIEYITDMKWFLMALGYGEPFTPETKGAAVTAFTVCTAIQVILFAVAYGFLLDIGRPIASWFSAIGDAYDSFAESFGASLRASSGSQGRRREQLAIAGDDSGAQFAEEQARIADKPHPDARYAHLDLYPMRRSEWRQRAFAFAAVSVGRSFVVPPVGGREEE